MPTMTEREWVLAKPGWLAGKWHRLARLFRRSVPDLLNFELTVSGLASFSFQALTVAAISLIPVAFAWWSGDATMKPGAWWQAGALACLQIAKIIFDRMKLSRSYSKHTMENLADMSVSLGHTIGKLSETIRVAQRHSAELDSLLQHALNCIAGTVKLLTNTGDERYFCVSLLTFEPDEQIKVRARSNSTRRTGKLLPAKETMAYWVARYRDENKAVHDFKAESKRGLQMLAHKSLSVPGKPPYVSILVLPLPSVAIPSQGKRRKGVVTIDASRCYEFLGRETAIQIRVQAYLELINLLLTNHTTGVEHEAQNG